MRCSELCCAGRKMQNNLIHGSIPEALWHLTQLSSLLLFNNKITVTVVPAVSRKIRGVSGRMTTWLLVQTPTGSGSKNREATQVRNFGSTNNVSDVYSGNNLGTYDAEHMDGVRSSGGSMNIRKARLLDKTRRHG